MKKQRLASLQQATDTNVSRVLAAFASGGSSFHSLVVPGRNENCLHSVQHALWVMELLAVTFSAQSVSSSPCCGIVPQMWH